jgi:hypothetical protein
MANTLCAQTQGWTFQTFDDNICGLNAIAPVTLTYDPAQNNTADSGGSCHVTVDYSNAGLFRVALDNVCCCTCQLEALLSLTNFSALEFDVKWDNSSAVPLSFFNTNSLVGEPGIGVSVGQGGYSGEQICQSNIFIPDAATNGWVHVVAPFNRNLNVSFVGLQFQNYFQGYSTPGYAAFWLDNIKLLPAHPVPVATPVSISATNFTLHFSCTQGSTYSILKSTDLIHWTTLVTNYPPGGASADGDVAFTDTNASATSAYYRIRSP